MEEKRYNINITTPGRVVVFRGKPCRTPVKFENVTETELNLLKTIIHKENSKAQITEFKSENLNYDRIEDIDIEIKDKEVKIEELFDKPKEKKSTLDALLE